MAAQEADSADKAQAIAITSAQEDEAAKILDDNNKDILAVNAADELATKVAELADANAAHIAAPGIRDALELLLAPA